MLCIEDDTPPELLLSLETGSSNDDSLLSSNKVSKVILIENSVWKAFCG